MGLARLAWALTDGMRAHPFSYFQPSGHECCTSFTLTIDWEGQLSSENSSVCLWVPLEVLFSLPN